MRKKNIRGLEKLAEGYLQYRWYIYLYTKKRYGEEHARPDFVHYCGACGILDAMGIYWERIYRGKNTGEQLDNIDLYSHRVLFPTDETCKRLNFYVYEQEEEQE